MTIYNNIINNNLANQGGGISCVLTRTPSLSIRIGSIVSNIISNNEASANGGGTYFSNSTNYNNSNTVLSNNTIANNISAMGGGMYCTNSANPVFKNTIFYGNTAKLNGNQVAINDQPSNPSFNYCDVQGGQAAFFLNSNIYMGTYQNNINSDPLFVAPSNGSGTGFDGTKANWSLMLASPCINAGDTSGPYASRDIAGKPRVSGGRVDIGAYEYQSGLTSIDNNHHENILNIFPNPNSGSFFIEINTSEMVKVSVFNILGEIVYSQELRIEGQSQIPVQLGLVAKEIYLLKLQSGNNILLKRIGIE